MCGKCQKLDVSAGNETGCVGSRDWTRMSVAIGCPVKPQPFIEQREIARTNSEADFGIGEALRGRSSPNTIYAFNCICRGALHLCSCYA